MSETFELSRFERAETYERTVVLPFHPVEPKDTVAPLRRPKNGLAPAPPLQLIQKLCEALNAQKISYCHWKSNYKLNRWLAGEGDLDLLVERADSQRFTSIISGLGFQQAEPREAKRVPGVLHFYGLDKPTGRLVHIHVYYQLVIGEELTENYHLATENIYLESSTRQGLMPVPSHEAELIVFVLRNVLRHAPFASWVRTAFGKRPNLPKQDELEFLESRVNPVNLANLLSRLAPSVDLALFNQCLQSLRLAGSFVGRLITQQQLRKRLSACARRPRLTDTLLKTERRLALLVPKFLLARNSGKRLSEGGILIALVGGDGSGKTTALDGLSSWLSNDFKTRRFHIGKPPRSLITFALIVMLRFKRLFIKRKRHGDFPGYVQLLRWVSASRDRRRHYLTARRFATDGGIALCDRYPIKQFRLMDGPNIAHTSGPNYRNRFVKLLSDIERSYYREIMPPDLLIVLRVNPDVAVQRKTTEDENHVRTRSTEVWGVDWNDSNAHVIDASKPAQSVLSEVQSIIWGRL